MAGLDLAISETSFLVQRFSGQRYAPPENYEPPANCPIT